MISLDAITRGYHLLRPTFESLINDFIQRANHIVVTYGRYTPVIQDSGQLTYQLLSIAWSKFNPQLTYDNLLALGLGLRDNMHHLGFVETGQSVLEALSIPAVIPGYRKQSDYYSSHEGSTTKKDADCGG